MSKEITVSIDNVKKAYHAAGENPAINRTRIRYTGYGSRLAFKSEELAEYAGKQFINIYADFIA